MSSLPSLKCPSHEPAFQLKDDVAPEPLSKAPSSAVKERSSDEQESRTEDASTAPSLLTVKDETQSHLTGSLRGHFLKHEKSVGEKLDGAHAGEKAGGSVHPEKANGSATTDKSKKTRGEPPFTKQEREEMETLLQELCGHLGQYSRIFAHSVCSIARVRHQSFILPGFWKVKMLRRTFCSTQTGCCHYQYTTSHLVIAHTAIEYHSQRFRNILRTRSTTF